MEETKITVIPNGPIIVEGKIIIKKASGDQIKESEKVALCRCAHSSDKLFCDGTHSKINFKAD